MGIAQYAAVKFNFFLKESRIWICFLYVTFYPNFWKIFTHIPVHLYKASLLASIGKFDLLYKNRIMGSEVFFFADQFELLLRFKMIQTLGVPTNAPY